MNFTAARNTGLDGSEKAQEFLMPVAPIATADGRLFD